MYVCVRERVCVCVCVCVCVGVNDGRSVCVFLHIKTELHTS